MRLPLVVLTTGLPVPRAAVRGGRFYDMISSVVRDLWPGPLVDVDATSMETLPAPHEVSGVIVTGSPARVATRDPWMLRVEASMRSFADSDTPLFGICFGHQLLGRALGGEAGPNPNGREIGTSELFVRDGDELLTGIEQPKVVVMTHLDSVTRLPPGARCLASTSLEQNAMVRFAANIWGVQFHPEMDAELVGDYIEDRRQDLIAEGLDPDALLQARVESGFAREILRRFVAKCRG